MTPPENWRPVVGFEDSYEVSDRGRVRSVDRWVDSPNRWAGVSRQFRPGRVLVQKHKTIKTKAYAYVNLSRHGKVTTHSVHTLVLEAFVGPRPPGNWARHGPAGLMDNSLANLSWGTPSDNAHDRVRDGNDVKANATHCRFRHKLADPNLEPCQGARGYRRCYACALTQMWGRGHGLRPGDEIWKAEADRRYAEIMRFGQPLNYRLATNMRPGRTRWTPGAAGPWAVRK